MVEQSKNELRCFCSRLPLLATYGVGDDSRLYVHIKVFKQNRIYGEILVTEGIIRLRCRECLRWNLVIFSETGQPSLQEDKFPSIDFDLKN